MPMRTLVISVEGGFVTSVTSDEPNAFSDVRVVIVDYDGDDDLVPVAQADGHTVQATVTEQQVEAAKIPLTFMRDKR